MHQQEMTAYINILINSSDKKPNESSSDKKPNESSSDNVKRWVSTKRKNGGKSNTIT